MKTKQGFVSNSSSTSFVIGKAYMNQKQINAFRAWANSRMSEVCEGDISETDYYFLGEFNIHNINEVVEFLENLGIDKKFVGTGDY